MWEAVEPDEKTPLADNCVVVSAEGDCNSLMAGGDFDGDLDMISFNTTLVDLARATQKAVEDSEWLQVEKARPYPSSAKDILITTYT